MLASNDTILHCTIPHHLGDWKAFRCDHVAGLIKAIHAVSFWWTGVIKLLVLRVVRGVVGQTSLVRQAIGMHELKDIRGVTSATTIA